MRVGVCLCYAKVLYHLLFVGHEWRWTGGVDDPIVRRFISQSFIKNHSERSRTREQPLLMWLAEWVGGEVRELNRTRGDMK